MWPCICEYSPGEQNNVREAVGVGQSVIERFLSSAASYAISAVVHTRSDAFAVPSISTTIRLTLKSPHSASYHRRCRLDEKAVLLEIRQG